MRNVAPPSGGAAGDKGVTLRGKVSGVPGQSVVYVDVIQGKTFPAPSVHPVIDQKGLMFRPNLTVIQVGTTVDFLNSDPVAHTVFWLSDKESLSHNLGTWLAPGKRSFRFDDAGVVSLLCNVHPEMTGIIVISPTPYYATTAKSGAYKIENVPEGDYTLTAWHAGAISQSKRVTVPDNTEVTFTLRPL